VHKVEILLSVFGLILLHLGSALAQTGKSPPAKPEKPTGELVVKYYHAGTWAFSDKDLVFSLFNAKGQLVESAKPGASTTKIIFNGLQPGAGYSVKAFHGTSMVARYDDISIDAKEPRAIEMSFPDFTWFVVTAISANGTKVPGKYIVDEDGSPLELGTPWFANPRKHTFRPQIPGCVPDVKSVKLDGGYTKGAPQPITFQCK
jgi:hypothetical protein